MLPIKISKESREPIYHQIVNQIKALIAGGQLAAGKALPSIRALSKELKVSSITARRAYQDLEAQGFIETLQGKGTFVADVSEKEKKKVKVSSVRNIMEHAIEAALSYDYSIEEIEEIFGEILAAFSEKKGG